MSDKLDHSSPVREQLADVLDKANADNPFWTRTVSLGLADKLIPVVEADRQRSISDAEKRGAAFAIMVVDQMHLGDARMDGQTDRFYKGVKNAIRDKFKKVTGVDPAPNYPVKVSEADLVTESGTI